MLRSQQGKPRACQRPFVAGLSVQVRRSGGRSQIMKFSGLSITARVAFCLATGLLATALILSAVLVAGDQFADGASKRTQKRTALLWSSHKPGATQQTKAGFLLHGEQNGQTSKRGGRPMGIIGILVGLKADQGYAFRFSTVGCRSGGEAAFTTPASPGEHWSAARSA
jgi:hypothetical protein